LYFFSSEYLKKDHSRRDIQSYWSDRLVRVGSRRHCPRRLLHQFFIFILGLQQKFSRKKSGKSYEHFRENETFSVNFRAKRKTFAKRNFAKISLFSLSAKTKTSIFVSTLNYTVSIAKFGRYGSIKDVSGPPYKSIS
jgi:hypothetical protein